MVGDSLKRRSILESKTTRVDSYLRVDKWMKDVKPFMFDMCAEPVDDPADTSGGLAMLRFREDVWIFAALEDEKRRKPAASRESPSSWWDRLLGSFQH